MLFVRSLAFNAFYFGWTTALMLSLWALTPFPAKTFRKGIRLWSVGGDWALRYLVGAKIEVRGLENLPEGPVLYAAKHQSTWETMEFLNLNGETAYVMKSELLKIPLWGWYMRKADHVVIDRSAGASSLRRLNEEVQRILNDQRSVVIFPEGTRVPAGKTGKYFPGVASIAGRIDCPVIPVAVNSGLWWGRRQFLKRPGTFVLEFLPPMPRELDRRSFMSELETRIETATRRLEEETNDF